MKPNSVATWAENDPRSKLPWLKPPDSRKQDLRHQCVEYVCVPSLKENAHNHLQTIWKDFESQSGALSKQDALRAWISAVQKERAEDYAFRSDETFEDFKQYMLSEWANALKDGITDQELDAHPMTDYFISSSHNTFLIGSQLYGNSTVDGYKIVLLAGCRCVEIDIWDGQPHPETEETQKPAPEPSKGTSNETTEDPEKPKPWRANTIPVAEPVVLHGHTATKMVPFRDVCDAIRKYAFVASDLPVIVSLEVHTNREQQQSMVDIMKESFKGMLCDPIDPQQGGKGPTSNSTELPSPTKLLKKILIKVKYSPPKANPEEEEPEPTELERNLSDQSSASSLPQSDDEAAKVVKKPGTPSKIIDALSQMGVYTRSCHFKSFTQVEASIPTHVFSLSEKSLLQVHKLDPVGLFTHNLKFFMRAFPKGSRILSSNLDPALYWRLGVQMVALNWQRLDAGMMLNEAMFANTNGWVLKPEGYRRHSTARPTPELEPSPGSSQLTVEFFAGQDIPLPKGVDAAKFKPYIKCELHVESDLNSDGKAKDGEYKQTINPVSTADPDFRRQSVHFDNVPALVPTLSFVRFKVMHDDRFSRDELAAWACIRLDRLGHGYRFLHLRDEKGMESKGVILVKIDYSWNVKDISVPVSKDPSGVAEGKTTPKKHIVDMEHKILHGLQNKLNL